ncbi:MAG: hypothetical protein Q8O31_01410 [Rhodocyclaceae bacterium]|nr:hypothetical protein [Rhodocyclaceae bacterium]
MNRFVSLLLLILALVACSSTPVGGVRGYPEHGTIVPNALLKLTPSISIELDKLVVWGIYAGVAWLVLDPLAPNWEIEEAPLPEHHIHFSLKMKRYYAGGQGEARPTFHRRAKELMQYNGFDGYEVVEYSESLDSSVLGSQRTATGVVRMISHKSKPVKKS